LAELAVVAGQLDFLNVRFYEGVCQAPLNSDVQWFSGLSPPRAVVDSVAGACLLGQPLEAPARRAERNHLLGGARPWFMRRAPPRNVTRRPAGPRARLRYKRPARSLWITAC